MNPTAPQPALESPWHTRPKNRQRWFELFLVVLLAIAPLTFQAIESLRSGPPSVNRPSFGVIVQIAHELSSVLLVVYILSRRAQGFRALGLSWRRIDVLIGFVLALAAGALSAFIRFLENTLFMAFTGHHASMPDPRIHFLGIPVGFMITYAVTSAFFEETVVRGYVTSELIGLAYPVWLATAASILLQASYHIYYGWGRTLEVSGVFIVLGVYFALSRRLMPVILAHFFCDLGAILANWISHILRIQLVY